MIDKITQTKIKQSKSDWLSKNHFSHTMGDEEKKNFYASIALKAQITKNYKKNAGIYPEVWNKGLNKLTDSRIEHMSGENHYLKKKNSLENKIVYNKEEITKNIDHLRKNTALLYDTNECLTSEVIAIKKSKIYIGNCGICNTEINYKGWRSFFNYLRGNDIICKKCHAAKMGNMCKGIKKSEELKQKLSIAAKNRTITPENEKIRSNKIRNAQKCRYDSMSDLDRIELNNKIKKGQLNKPEEEIRSWHKKQSYANVRRIKELGDESKFRPRYNINSIPIIEEFGLKHNYNFRHALNHVKGEFHIYDKERKRSYYADAYDEHKNTWLEYDERGKFNSKNELSKEHRLREERIKYLLKCNFIRIKEENNN